MIRETVVTTRDADGGDHLAPLGIHPHGGDTFILAPFKPSATLDNLLRERCAVINYSDDVRVFAGCLSGRRDWPLTAAARVNARRLSGALAHVEVKVTQVQDDELRPRLTCAVVHQETHAPFKGFNRAQAAIIELAILVSRLHLLPWEKIEREIAYLQIAVDKTAGANEKTAWGWLLDRIEAFKLENNIR